MNSLRAPFIIFLLGCTAGTGCMFATPPIRPVDWTEISFYAQVASSVYGGDEEKAYLPQLLDEWDIVADSTPKTNVRYYLMTHRKDLRQLISIRGTLTAMNVLDDAEYMKRKDGALDIYLHEGFGRCARELYAGLGSKLDTARAIEITGHSLGGAVALILAMELDRSKKFKISKIMTFGQPKVTNEDGVRRFRHLPLTRVVDERDVVPLVPPATLLSMLNGMYRHLGEEIILLDGIDYSYLDKSTAEQITRTSFWLHLDEESMDDHHMGKYIERITTKRDSSKFIRFEHRRRCEN